MNVEWLLVVSTLEFWLFLLETGFSVGVDLCNFGDAEKRKLSILLFIHSIDFHFWESWRDDENSTRDCRSRGYLVFFRQFLKIRPWSLGLQSLQIPCNSVMER